MGGGTARCFVGLWLPEAARTALDPPVRRLQRVTAGVRWVAPSRWHVTLAFLGDVPRARLVEVRAALRSLEFALPIRLGIRGLGAFPDLARPRIVWAGLDGDVDKLASLADRVAAVLETLGFAREERPFRPHVTLGRVKHARAVPVLRAALGSSHVVVPAAQVGAFSLFESSLTPDGPDYVELERFDGSPSSEDRGSGPAPSQARGVRPGVGEKSERAGRGGE